MIRTFDIEIFRNLDEKHITWLSKKEISELIMSQGLNYEYRHLDARSWTEVGRLLEQEEEYVFEEASLTIEQHNALQDERYDEDFDLFQGIDLGVASLVTALYTAGCRPITSCNGGCFGDSHKEDYPIVVFYARPQYAPLLLEAAIEANVGLTTEAGRLTAYTGDIRHMVKFARAIVERQKQFGRLKRMPSNILDSSVKANIVDVANPLQQKLDFD